MAATSALRHLRGSHPLHRGLSAEKQSFSSEPHRHFALWGRQVVKPRRLQQSFTVRASAVGNGADEALRPERKAVSVSREEGPAPIELFVLADASDDDIEDETLEEMDDDEALFEDSEAESATAEESVSDLAEATSSQGEEVASDQTEEVATNQGAEVATNQEEEVEDVEEEVELSWAQEKYLDLKESVQVGMEKIPGPRVASSNLPWLIAVPLSYLAITLLIAIAKVIKKYNTPRAARKRQVNRNLELVQLIDNDLKEDRSRLNPQGFRALQKNFKFSADEILRKYIRYALNEKSFDPQMVSNLILLRQSSGLADKDIVAVLNDISRRVVKSKGAVMMDTRGMTQKGIKRKAAVQALFTKLLYLSELDEFLSPEARVIPERKAPPPKAAEPLKPDKDAPLVFNPEMLKKQATKTNEADLEAEQNQYLRIKEIFGITDEDADSIRIETLSDADVLRLEALLGRRTSQGGDMDTADGDTEESSDDEERDEKDEDS